MTLTVEGQLGAILLDITHVTYKEERDLYILHDGDTTVGHVDIDGNRVTAGHISLELSNAASKRLERSIEDEFDPR